MLSSHERCPICQKDFVNAKYLAKPCAVINKTSLSYIESICNRSEWTSSPSPIPEHSFFQITSLYGELLFQKILFAHLNAEVEVNYVLDESVITYFPKADIHCITQINLSPSPFKMPEKVIVKRRRFDLDFPFLSKTINKIKTLAPFL